MDVFLFLSAIFLSFASFFLKLFHGVENNMADSESVTSSTAVSPRPPDGGSSPRPSLTFLDLPSEVRCIVYRFLLPEIRVGNGDKRRTHVLVCEHGHNLRHNSIGCAQCVTPLLRVSRLISLEFHAIFRSLPIVLNILTGDYGMTIPLPQAVRARVSVIEQYRNPFAAPENAVVLAQILKARYPNLQILKLSAHQDGDEVEDAEMIFGAWLAEYFQAETLNEAVEKAKLPFPRKMVARRDLPTRFVAELDLFMNIGVTCEVEVWFYDDGIQENQDSGDEEFWEAYTRAIVRFTPDGVELRELPDAADGRWRIMMVGDDQIGYHTMMYGTRVVYSTITAPPSTAGSDE